MTDHPYSFRLEASSPIKIALDQFLTDNYIGERGKSRLLIALIHDGLVSRGLLDDNAPARAQTGTYEDLRNDLRYELENALKGFVLDLLKDNGRMSVMQQISDDIANGGDIDDDILDNILEGFK